RGQHLLLGRRPRSLAREGRAPRQYSMDRVVAKHDPVTDGGQLRGRGNLVAQAAGQANTPLAGLGEHVVAAAVLRGDSGRLTFVFVWLERGAEALVPAEVVQVQASLPQESGDGPDTARGWRARYRGVLWLAGSLRLCDRRVQSSS